MNFQPFFISEAFMDDDPLDNYIDDIFSSISEITNLLQEDPDLVNIAEVYIKDWCLAENIPFLLSNIAINIWRQNNENFPSLDQIVEYINRSPCECSMDMNNEDRKALIRIYLIKNGNIPSCDFTIVFKAYVQEHNAIPTYDTVESILNRLNNIMESNYFEEKVKVGTKNIEHIPVFTCNDEYDCSLCIDKITKGQTYHKLQPCGHYFHANGDDCIDSTVVKWLTDNHTCPNCRKDVHINEPSLTNSKKIIDEVD